MDPPPRDHVAGDPTMMAGLFEGDIQGVRYDKNGKLLPNLVNLTLIIIKSFQLY